MSKKKKKPSPVSLRLSERTKKAYKKLADATDRKAHYLMVKKLEEIHLNEK